MSNTPNVDKKKQEFLEALKKHLGIISHALDEAELSYGKYRRWMAADDAFRQEVQDINERALDIVEGKMFELIHAGNANMIMFYMRTKGASRGYSEKPLIGIESINPVQIVLPNGGFLPQPNTIDITPEEDDGDPD